MKLLTAQRDVLSLLADSSLQFSNYLCKPRIVRVEADYSETVIARVQNGIAGALVDAGMMRYVGFYELTDKGKVESVKLAAANS